MISSDFDQLLLEMRARCLSLAADLDRIERAGISMGDDPRLSTLFDAIALLLVDQPGERAAQVQMIFSDQTPPPQRND